MHPITFHISAEHDTDADDPKLTKLIGGQNDGQIIFTVDKEKGTLTTDVKNYKGELPDTGGMGTTILYAAGVILILVAGAFLVMQKKAEDK